MIPGSVLVAETSPTPSPFLVGDDTPDLGLVSREVGPATLNTPGGDINVRMWVADYSGGSIRLYPEDDLLDITTLLTVAGVVSLSLAFSQNGLPHVAYTAGDVAYLYWYDSTTEQYATLTLTGATTPILTMDDKRTIATNENQNDILVLYIAAPGLCYRMQRERFETEHVATAGVSGSITRAGMCNDWRLRVEVEQPT